VPAVKEFGLTEALRDAGVIPFNGLMFSQFAVAPDDAFALKLTGVVLPSTALLVITTGRGSGILPPISYANTRAGGRAEMRMSGIVSVTGIINGLFDADGDATISVPVYMPGLSVTALMPTMNVAGVFVEGGLTDNQSPPESVVANAVSPKPLLGVSLVTVSDCVLGRLLPN
jgi:hypothetical protein